MLHWKFLWAFLPWREKHNSESPLSQSLLGPLLVPSHERKYSKGLVTLILTNVTIYRSQYFKANVLKKS
jgi:hypothetical protein